MTEHSGRFFPFQKTDPVSKDFTFRHRIFLYLRLDKAQLLNGCQNAAIAMFVIHIHNGQNPMNKMTESVRDEVPVAT